MLAAHFCGGGLKTKGTSFANQSLLDYAKPYGTRPYLGYAMDCLANGAILGESFVKTWRLFVLPGAPRDKVFINIDE